MGVLVVAEGGLRFPYKSEATTAVRSEIAGKKSQAIARSKPEGSARRVSILPRQTVHSSDFSGIQA
jgi:hypothetical protein